MKQGTSLLDHQAARMGAYISDLRVHPGIKRSALRDMRRIPKHRFPVEQWNQALSYMLDRAFSFSTVEQAKQFIKNATIKEDTV